MSAAPAGIIFLTFDDHFTDAWVQALPLLTQYGARVTFFVSEFDRLTRQQIDDLHRLAEAGHEIGCHGLTHASAVDCLAARGPEGFLAEEIDPAIRVMELNGFAARSYAYPRSQRSEATDAVLLRRFARLRSGWTAAFQPETVPFERCFVPMAELAERRLLIGKSIDQAAITDQQLDDLIARAADTAACVTLYGHTIEDQAPHHHVSPDRLNRLLRHATRRNVQLRCFSDSAFCNTNAGR